MHDVLGRVISELGLTVIIVEQNIYAGLDLSERGFVILNGSVALEKTAAELRNSEDLIRSYLGG